MHKTTDLYFALLDHWNNIFRLQGQMARLFWGMHGHSEAFTTLSEQGAGERLSGRDESHAIDARARLLLARYSQGTTDLEPMPGFTADENAVISPESSERV